MIMKLLRCLVSAHAKRTGRLLGLYRRLCQPDGAQWGEIVKRHFGLAAVGHGCLLLFN